MSYNRSQRMRDKMAESTKIRLDRDHTRDKYRRDQFVWAGDIRFGSMGDGAYRKHNSTNRDGE